MRTLRPWLIGFLVAAGVVLASAALTPPIHRLLEGWGLLAGATDADRLHAFLKVLRRILVILAILAIAFGLRPARDGGLRSYGLRGPDRPRAYVLHAALLTLVAGLLILGLHALQGWLHFEDPLRYGKIGRRVLSWGGRAVALATVEELFFRGWLWRKVQRGVGLVWGAVISSVIFGVVHAFRPSNFKGTVTLDTAGALDALGEWSALALDPQRFLPAAFGLFLLGLVLCAAYRRTRSLWTPIAVHAMGMSLVYIHPSITNRWPKETWAGSGALFDGPPGWILLLLALWMLTRPRAPEAVDVCSQDPGTATSS